MFCDKIVAWIPMYHNKKYNHYKVSTDGRIKNNNGKILKTITCRFGYHRVRVSNKGSVKALTVNRVVANHFIGRRDHLEVNHDDRDKSNNSVYNFTWMTPSENQRHWRNNSERNICEHTRV